MERSIESERTRFGFEGLETDPEASSEAKRNFGAEPQSLGAARIYAKPLGGIAAILALLALPALTLPGLAIFALIGEIYLIDWTYSKYSEARNGMGQLADIKALKKEANPGDEIDSFAARTGPKDQFTR
jgi:hypothetical protein